MAGRCAKVEIFYENQNHAKYRNHEVVVPKGKKVRLAGIDFVSVDYSVWPTFVINSRGVGSSRAVIEVEKGAWPDIDQKELLVSVDIPTGKDPDVAEIRVRGNKRPEARIRMTRVKE